MRVLGLTRFEEQLPGKGLVKELLSNNGQSSISSASTVAGGHIVQILRLSPVLHTGYSRCWHCAVLHRLWQRRC